MALRVQSEMNKLSQLPSIQLLAGVPPAQTFWYPINHMVCFCLQFWYQCNRCKIYISLLINDAQWGRTHLINLVSNQTKHGLFRTNNDFDCHACIDFNFITTLPKTIISISQVWKVLSKTKLIRNNYLLMLFFLWHCFVISYKYHFIACTDD